MFACGGTASTAPAVTPTPTPLPTGSGGLPVGSSGSWYSVEGPRGAITYFGNLEAALTLHRPALHFAEFAGRRPAGAGEYVAFAITMEVLRAHDYGVGAFVGQAVCKVKDDSGRALTSPRLDRTFATDLARALGVEPELIANAVGAKITSVFVYVTESPVSAIDVDCRYSPSGPQLRYEGKDLFVWRPA